MPKKRKPSLQKKSESQTEHSVPDFHICFPYTLTHVEQKEKKTCWFSCSEHMDKYIKRYNLKKSDYTISETQPKLTLDDFV